MQKNASCIGGFAAVNNGTIRDCYSVVEFSAKKFTSGGFVGNNTLNIISSYAYNRLNGEIGGFTGTGNDSTTSCYFFHNEKEGSKKIEKLWDRANGQRLSELKDEDTLKALGFDLDEIWEMGKGSVPLRFIEEKWLFETRLTHILHGVASSILTISTADELLSFAEKVNKGDVSYMNADVRLTKDIDLSGKEWIPIGNTRTCAFSGLFDGCGHTIQNFVIKDKKCENKGLFGFLKAKVYNLIVDCNLRGNGCMGGIAAQNIGGVIGCCGAIVSIKGGKNTTAGGLVGKNSGEVFSSYAAGRIHFIIIPVWPFFALAGLLATFMIIIPMIDSQPVFNPIPDDPNQKPIQGENIDPKKDTNYVGFQFEQNIEIDRSTGIGTINFKNPGDSNHNIVIYLQITDQLSTQLMGGTNRTAEEQKKLEDNGDYDPTVSRTTIAESLSLKAGYQLENITLNSFAKAKLPSGEYKAMIYIVFYDIGTNNRAMLESQLPVVISVY